MPAATRPGCYEAFLRDAERAMARSLARYGRLSPVVVCRRQKRYEPNGFKRLGAERTLAPVPRLSARLLEADSGPPRQPCTG